MLNETMEIIDVQERLPVADAGSGVAFDLRQHCEAVAKASHASVLVDYANYYRALYESICKARHSVFVLGWDIDSRIRLLRSDDAKKTECPIRFFDLIQWKARQNPGLKIYLNRWDYTLHLALEREMFAGWKWRLGSPANVHYCADHAVALGGCHHQKIVVVDDEVAFCGGMDIAQCRWDRREHYPLNRHRVDPKGTLGFGWKRFGPYHDVQMVVAGPAVRPLAQLARDRWKHAAGEEAAPIRPQTDHVLPDAWPDSTAPQFIQAPVGMALTMPPRPEQEEGVHQVEKLYLELVAQAEQFIYMENQYFCYEPVAHALNRRMKERPELRVLLVGSYEPEGIMERKAMWHGRYRFRRILEEGITNRVALTYPVSRVKNVEKRVRIHSKTMIVDDRYLRVGSSNLNWRSMRVDTECDLVVEGVDARSRRNISMVRADLIREHTGHELAYIEACIREGAGIDRLLEEVPHSRQHLRRVKDEAYRHERFAGIAARLADPKEPFFHWG
ncbi:hypothetical protein GC177_08820 [bacterium]|nr:hypothetical protein [bacterium]